MAELIMNSFEACKHGGIVEMANKIKDYLEKENPKINLYIKHDINKPAEAKYIKYADIMQKRGFFRKDLCLVSIIDHSPYINPPIYFENPNLQDREFRKVLEDLFNKNSFETILS